MYDSKTVYAKYLQNKISGGECGGCSGCGESHGGCAEQSPCDCCPPGLVSVKDAQGSHVACLSPNDAQEYQENVKPVCSEGFVALYKEGVTPLFRGCVPAADFADLYAALNPSE